MFRAERTALPGAPATGQSHDGPHPAEPADTPGRLPSTAAGPSLTRFARWTMPSRPPHKCRTTATQSRAGPVRPWRGAVWPPATRQEPRSRSRSRSRVKGQGRCEHQL